MCSDGKGAGVNVIRESANYKRELILMTLIVIGCVCVCELVWVYVHFSPDSWHLGNQSPVLKSCFSPEWDFCSETITN